MRQDVSDSIVDIVTVRNFNLDLDLLDFFGQFDRQFSRADRSIYAATCAVRNDGTQWSLKSWAFPLSVGERLPTIPLILSDWLGVNLDLEAPFEATLDAVS